MLKKSDHIRDKEIEELKNRLEEAEQLIEAIREGEVDAFAFNNGNGSEVYTLQSGDYAYRVLIENFNEGALNLSDEGIIVYTNAYFHKLLKLPYEKVIGSSIFNFIDPSTKDNFNELFKESHNGQSKGEINLTESEKTIPVYISLTSLHPNLPTIGMIVTDLTEKKRMEDNLARRQRDLEEKNQQLIRSNTELASFSYIASHDLQEPLRKIKTFSMRIMDKGDITNVSKDYFDRIISATERMQELITALLNYSRTNTSGMDLHPVDLNIAVQDIKNSVADLLEETHAIIEAGPLPVLEVIPHQFTQLLTNIILNAVKYRRPGVDPVIKINADIISADQMQDFSAKQDTHYYLFTVADNGIGFDQKHAEKIFELFQRLHGKSEYEGTGIGLAICKKIVQNHSGFISATGSPDRGAIFKVYLPIKHSN